MVFKIVEEFYNSFFLLESISTVPETLHIIKDVELLPPFAEIHLTVRQGVSVANVDEGQILQDQTTDVKKNKYFS